MLRSLNVRISDPTMNDGVTTYCYNAIRNRTMQQCGERADSVYELATYTQPEVDIEFHELPPDCGYSRVATGDFDSS